MQNSFYTNVQVYGSKILYRGIEEGRKVRKSLDYNPSLFVRSNKPSEFTTVMGEYVEEIKPGSIRDCRNFINSYKDIDNFEIYGMQRFEYAFISDQFPGEVAWDKNQITICNIDIEVGSENGFPDPVSASEPITAITFKTANKFIVLGYADFVNTREDVQFIKCFNELDLIKRFIDEWTNNYPDIVTGWNIKFFDIPYLVNRISKLMGPEYVKRFSPWNIITDRKVILMGKEQFTYVPVGVSIIDYLELYKKYSPGGNSQESYRLDHICSVEINEKKLSYEEYGNLHTLYRDNPQLFFQYNIKDVELVEKLDDKCKLIDLVLTLSYDNKCNYEDVFTQVRMWDVIIYNDLKKKNIVIPPNKKHRKNQAYVGAYVKDPIIGKHDWIASFDLDSLYPHLIMQYSISPDSHVSKEYLLDRIAHLEKSAEDTEELDDLRQLLVLSSQISVDRLLKKEVDCSLLKKYQLTITPNGEFFSISKQGFLAKIMEDMYNNRSEYKKKSIQAKKEYETETDLHKKEELEKTIAKYNNLQLAKKVGL
jgi:DNA polymerase elongation subunit (family B)